MPAKERKFAMMNSFIDGIPRAEQDTTRPLYHFHAPSQWMDDPNGIIYHKGYYHLMYSCNPFDDAHRAGPEYKQEPTEEEWGKPGPNWNEGVTGWGHARSKDLVRWEHLPMAIYPSEEQGEYFCWFGSTVIRKDGTPICFYSSIGKTTGPISGTTQWAATGSEDLIQWEKVPGNPVMPREINKEEIMRWCDPHVFFYGDDAYCLIGGKLDDPDTGTPVICLYKALNEELTKWSYKGILFRHPNKNLRSMECPNIFEMNGKWVLILSPHGPLEYWVGDLDPEKCEFKIEKMGYIDRGTHLYASNFMRDDTGRILLWGAVEGFTENKGWRGCLCLPRVLTMDDEHNLLLNPAKELQTLRREERRWQDMELKDEWVMPDGVGNTAEIQVRLQGPGDVKLSLMNGDDCAFGICRRDQELEIDGGKAKFPAPSRDILTLQIFIDRTVIEVFVNGKECYTGVIKSCEEKRNVKICGAEKLAECVCYDIDAADIFTFSYGELREGSFVANEKLLG